MGGPLQLSTASEVMHAAEESSRVGYLKLVPVLSGTSVFNQMLTMLPIYCVGGAGWSKSVAMFSWSAAWARMPARSARRLCSTFSLPRAF